MKNFYHGECSPDTKELTLDFEQSNHAVKVLRLREGDEVSILNGKGDSFLATIASADSKKCKLDIIRVIESFELKPRFHLGISILKSRERMEWLVEKSVEIGASKISFFNSERTEKGNIRMDRMESIAISALKQSGSLWLPAIFNLSYEKLLSEDAVGEKFIAHCETSPREYLAKIYSGEQDAFILIGPEGDFTKDEIKSAESSGFTSVNLGPLRLRSETAAMVGLCTLQIRALQEQG